MQFPYSAASFAVLFVMAQKGLGRYPWFLLHCAATAFWLTVYRSHDDYWLAYWQVPMYISLVGLRLAAAIEAVWRISEGTPKLRRMLSGTSGLAVGCTLLAWRNSADLVPAVQIRNYVQIGTFLLLLVPLMTFSLCSEGRHEDIHHGRILACLLGIHAGVSWLLLAGVRFSHAQWVAVDVSANLGAFICCLAWLTDALDSRYGPGGPGGALGGSSCGFFGSSDLGQSSRGSSSGGSGCFFIVVLLTKILSRLAAVHFQKCRTRPTNSPTAIDDPTPNSAAMIVARPLASARVSATASRHVMRSFCDWSNI